MKILIASDVHGSATCIRQLLERFREECVEHLILLGDIYNHGPRNPLPEGYDPIRVADILNGITDRLTVLKGNCDSEVDTMISRFEFVAEMTLLQNNKKIFLQHGDRFHRDCLPKNCGNALIYGHFHTGFIEKTNGITIANPGSVSLPKNNTPRSYLILENGELILKDMQGHILAREQI